MKELDDLKKAIDDLKAAKGTNACPSCGHCPTCGRGGYNTLPYPYPYYPWHQPYYTWTAQQGASTGNLTITGGGVSQTTCGTAFLSGMKIAD